MEALPTRPPVAAPEPPHGYAAALRLLLLWGPIAGYASLRLSGVLTNADSPDGLKTLAFLAAVAFCLLLQAGAARLEGRRIHATSPSANLDLLRGVSIGVAIINVSVIATAFTGFEIAYDID